MTSADIGKEWKHLPPASASPLRLSGWRLIRLLVLAFILIGSVYPVLRIELMARTGISSSVLGFWQDTFSLLILLTLMLQRGPARIGRTLPEVAVALILVCGILGVIISLAEGTGSMAIAYGLRLTYIPMIYYFAGRSFAVSERDVLAVHRILILVIALSAAIGLLFSYAFREYWFKVVLASDERGWGLYAISRVGGFRMTGATLDPVAFGTLCAWGVVLSLNGFRSLRGAANKILLILGLSLCSIGAVMSLTRGAWVAMAVGIVITVGLTTKRLVAITALVAAVLVGAYGLSTMRGENDVLTLLRNTVQKTVVEGNQQRVDMWGDSVAAFMDKPLGYGLGAVGHAGERFWDQVPADAPVITDGWYHKLLAEGGILLFASFCLFQITTIFHLMQLITKRDACPGIHAFRTATLAIFIAASVQALASNLWDLFYLSQIIWFVTGLGTRVDIASPGGRS